MVMSDMPYPACNADNNRMEPGLGGGQPRQEFCSVLDNGFMAESIAKIRLLAPYVAENCHPGQFVHLRLPNLEAHILRRPFSVYAADTRSGEIQLLYQTVGAGTEHLTTVGRGAQIDVIGPIGRGWQPQPSAKRVLLVGGGLGVAPLYMLAASFRTDVEVHLVMGAQSADRLICREPFSTYITEPCLHITTDDGSAGQHCFTTKVVKDLLDEGSFDYIATCGPEAMQKAVAALAAEHKTICEVSLERRMACGIGACLSCMVETINGPQRACVDGPVFSALEVIW